MTRRFVKCWYLPSLLLNVFDFVNGKFREEHPGVHLAGHQAWIGKNIIQCKYSFICYICRLRTNTSLSGLHVFFSAFLCCGLSCGSSTYTPMHILATGLHKLDLLMVAGKVILVVAFAFLPQILRSWQGPTNDFYQSVSAVWVDGTLIGGGDTQTLTVKIKFFWTFYTLRQWGCQSIILPQRITLWNFHYLIFSLLIEFTGLFVFWRLHLDSIFYANWTVRGVSSALLNEIASSLPRLMSTTKLMTQIVSSHTDLTHIRNLWCNVASRIFYPCQL